MENLILQLTNFKYPSVLLSILQCKVSGVQQLDHIQANQATQYTMDHNILD